jgi:bacterioferritin-associated ferredoxin
MVGMGPDDKICYCYNVPYRKLVNYVRRHNLQRASQLSECLGAGTGCGWCIPILKRIFESVQQNQDATNPPVEMTAEQYADLRQSYIKNKAPKNTF